MKSGFTEAVRLETGPDAPLALGWKHMFIALWRGIFPLIRANLCLLLFCLPVVTIPAACCALHGICLDVIRDRPVRVFHLYLRAVREQSLPTWGAALCLGTAELVSVVGAVFYFQRSPDMWLFLIPGLICCAAAVAGLLMLPYVFTMLARVDLTLKQVLKNAFLLVFLDLKFSVCGGVIFLSLAAAQLALFWRAIPLILTIGISAAVYFTTYFCLYGLQRFILTEEL